MSVLKAIGIGLLSILVTALMFFGGFIFSVVSIAVSVIGAVLMAFFAVFLFIAGMCDNKKQDK
jgi:hypothetical protein